MADDIENADVRLYPPWREALERFLTAGFKADDIVPHKWFFDAFGIEEPQDNMRHDEAKALELKRLKQFEQLQKALLEDHKIDLVSEPGAGYRITPPSEQSKDGYTEMLHDMAKAYRKGVRRVLNTDISLLTDEQRRDNANHLAKLAHVKLMIKQSRKMPEIE
jgi:hypothetical protein